MKRVVILVAAIVVGVSSLAQVSNAQFKNDSEEQPKASEYLVRNAVPTNFLSWLNLNNLAMRHQFSLSYSSLGGRGISLASYTNSLFYRIADPLDVSVDISMLYSPYSSFGSDELNRVYISNAELNYRPWDNFSIQLQYRQLPPGFYSPYYNPFYGPYR